MMEIFSFTFDSLALNCFYLLLRTASLVACARASRDYVLEIRHVLLELVDIVVRAFLHRASKKLLRIDVDLKLLMIRASGMFIERFAEFSALCSHQRNILSFRSSTPLSRPTRDERVKQETSRNICFDTEILFPPQNVLIIALSKYLREKENCAPLFRLALMRVDFK